MAHLISDLRYAFRVLAARPGFTVAAVLTLALGIGANTAIFRVINAALLRDPAGIEHPDRLFRVFRSQKAEAFGNSSYPNYAAYRDRNRSAVGLACQSSTYMSFSHPTAERIRGDLVSGNYFQVLEVRPAIGRLLNPDDDSTARRVAVISYGLWQREFAADPRIAGSEIAVNGFPFTIIGVAPQEFRGALAGDLPDVWVPISTQPETMPRLSRGILQDGAAGWLEIFGRLKPGLRFEQAEAEMKTIAAQLAQEYPIINGQRTVRLERGVGLDPDDRAEVSRLLAVLAVAVALLFLIASANVAGLFMVRAAARRREIAVRLAVGASRAHIIRQLLTEGIILSLVGGLLGLLFSQWAAQLVSLPLSTSVFRRLETGIDAHVLIWVVFASLAAGLILALPPALGSLPVDLASSLKDGGPGAGHGRSRTRPVLVVAQVALSAILLSTAGLLLVNLFRLVTADPGFETRNVAMASLDLTLLPYSQERGEAIYRQLLERLSAEPGIVSASLAGTVPPRDLSGRVSIFYPGQEPPTEVFHGREFDLGLRVDLDVIAPNYFRTLGVSVLRGRDFTDRDKANAPGIVIMNESLARRLWPGRNPIGQRISWPLWSGPRRPPLEVVGVVADTRYRSLSASAPLLMYAPLLQNYGGRTIVVARTAGAPQSALVAIQSALQSIDKNLAAYAPETMSEHIAASLWQQRMAAVWIGAFSLLAVFLSAVGLYGVIAQSVARRTREVGIRMALGADPMKVTWLVVKEGMLLASAGLAIGVPLALGLSALLRSFVSEPAAKDTLTYVAVAMFLSAIMLFASWIPARRAARIDPSEALRCQ